jgi:hypothetical protein
MGHPGLTTQHTEEYWWFPFMILWLSENYTHTLLPLADIAIKYWTAYHQPRKRSTLKIQSMVSTEAYFFIPL